MNTSCTCLHDGAVDFSNYVYSQAQISYYNLWPFISVELLLPSSVARLLQSLCIREANHVLLMEIASYPVSLRCLKARGVTRLFNG